MKKMTLILLISCIAASVNSRRTSTVTVATTSTSTSTFYGFAITKYFRCAILANVFYVCGPFSRNKIQSRDTMILVDELKDSTKIHPHIGPKTVPTETLRGEVTVIMQLPEEANVQSSNQPQLESKSPNLNVIEPSMRSWGENLFGWNKMSSSSWNEEDNQPRIFLLQILSIYSLILDRILPPITVTTTATIRTETSIELTATTNSYRQFVVSFCTDSPFPFSICPEYQEELFPPAPARRAVNLL